MTLLFFLVRKNIEVENNLNNLLKEKKDIIVISTGHSFYSNNELLMNYILKNDKLFIFDSVGLFSEQEIKKIKNKQIIKILGRGTI